MQCKNRLLGLVAAPLLLALAATATAQDANIKQPIADLERLLAAEPLVITQAEISRPKAKGDITLKADVSFGGAPPLRVKLRKAEPGADSFNNVPRYDLAAYELQKLFLDPAEYVVPPTALRMVPLADFAKYSPGVKRTFPDRRPGGGRGAVLAERHRGRSRTSTTPRVLPPIPVYARHIGQLNVLTYLIRHRDSNLGNFLIGKAEVGARVFSIDHGVAFASDESDRGELWKDMRVNRLPADTVERLRRITPQLLTERLAVLAQWQLQGRQLRSRGERREPVGKAAASAVKATDLQMGLSKSEIRAVHRLLTRLLERVDRGEITLAPAPGA